jgi:nitrogen-specific signal transduction histidine kinase
MGGVFGLTTNATSTPAQFSWFGKSSAPTELAHDLKKPLSGIQDPLLRLQRGHAVLCNQWIEDQSAIDTAEDHSFL